MTQEEALRLLYREVHECIEYVGSANYPERESRAKRAVTAAFTAYADNTYENIRGCLNRCVREDKIKEAEYPRS